jgi:ribosomal protein S18 acetylase RimI-like enzyme
MPQKMEYPVIKVREFLLTDREGVLAVFRSNVPTHFADSEEPFLEKTLEGPDGPLFVVADSNRIVGFGGYETSDFYNRSTLVWGMVHSARHHQGLGRKLLIHRLLHMAASPDRPRYAAVDTTPHIAGFYVKSGFEVLASWPNGYRSGFDCVDLRLELTEAVLAELKRVN